MCIPRTDQTLTFNYNLYILVMIIMDTIKQLIQVLFFKLITIDSNCTVHHFVNDNNHKKVRLSQKIVTTWEPWRGEVVNK